MPFRHLLYNRRDGAPQRPPPTSNQPDQFYVPAHLAQYQWSEMDFAMYQSHQGNPTAMNMEQSYPSKRQALSIVTQENGDGPLLQHGGFAHHPEHSYSASTDGFYRTGPFPYPDMMDTEVSSVSQGSLYSSMTGHSQMDSVLDNERFSLPSSSRKPSASSEGGLQLPEDSMCPLLAGQAGKCSAAQCGPDSPCLHFSSLPAMGDCDNLPHNMQISGLPTTMPRETSFSPTQRSPKSDQQRPRTRRQRTATITEAGNHGTIADKRKPRSRASQKSATQTKSAGSPEDDTLTLEQSNKIRARQAHSLVERKYRENLNAKIQLLHQRLQETEFGPRNITFSRISPPTCTGDDEEDEDHDEDGRAQRVNTTGSKFKKSDVLTEAMAYVDVTEVEMRHMTDEIRRLNARVHALEKLVKCEDCNLMKQMVTLKLQKVA